MGADKTGSTSIQEFFDRNRKTLIAQGTVAYPPGHWQAQFGSCFSEDPVKYVWNSEQGRSNPESIRASDDQYLKDFSTWLEQVEPCDELVLSYEGFIGLSTPALQRVREFLLQHAEAVVASIYIRPPLSYAISAMSQRVKMGRQAWDENNIPFFSSRHYLETVRNAFGAENMVVRAFDRQQLFNGDVVADFIQLLSTRPDDVLALYKAEKIQNESLSDVGIRVGEKLINHLQAEGIQFPPAIFNLKFGNKLAAIAGKKQKLSLEQIQAILQRQAAVQKYLADLYGLQFVEDPAQYVGAAKPQDELQQTIENIHFTYLLDAVADELKVHCTGGRYTPKLRSLKMAPSETIQLDALLSNRGCRDWLSTKHYPINLSYHVYKADGTLDLFDGVRTPMSPTLVQRGKDVAVQLAIKAPAQPGKYEIRLTLVQEGVCWFEERGFQMESIVIGVK